MWSTIERARRRLSGGSAAHRDPSPTSPTMPTLSSREETVIVLRGFEVDRLGEALQNSVGSIIERPDTPDRIERALSLFFDRSGARGSATVLRRPAGLSTPESWEIHFDGADDSAVVAVREAARTGRFA